VFLAFPGKIAGLIMESQDTATLYLFKLWPWVEANLKRIIIGVVLVAVLVFVISFYFWRQNQREVDAGNAMTQAIVSSEGGLASDALLKVADEYPNTMAGKRALLQAAAELFTAGKYADAQKLFQEFLDQHPNNEFSARAALGVAASLYAAGKTNQAFDAYQRVVNGFAEITSVTAAKFALARINDAQGKTSAAYSLYQDIANSNPGSGLASEAAVRAMELKSKLPSVPAPTTASTNPATPLLLNH
jgi:predicted negative regulator of RcsB-dependent stress response